jgi:hypothetical protein
MLNMDSNDAIMFVLIFLMQNRDRVRSQNARRPPPRPEGGSYEKPLLRDFLQFEIPAQGGI